MNLPFALCSGLLLEQEITAPLGAWKQLSTRGVRGSTCSLLMLEQRPINCELGFSFPPKHRRPRDLGQNSFRRERSFSPALSGNHSDARPPNRVGPPLGMPSLSFHPHRGCPAKVPVPHCPPTFLASSMSHTPQPRPFPEVA